MDIVEDLRDFLRGGFQGVVVRKVSRQYFPVTLRFCGESYLLIVAFYDSFFYEMGMSAVRYNSSVLRNFVYQGAMNLSGACGVSFCT
jgi:hypothetical protein